MPRKRNQLVPLPVDENPAKVEPEDKVKTALEKAKSVLRDDNDDSDDDVEFVIEPIVKVEPVVEKPKRKYTRKPKATPVVEPQNQYDFDFLKRENDVLKRENDILKSQKTLSAVSRLNTLARTMRVQF
jgi:hypothetical protein